MFLHFLGSIFLRLLDLSNDVLVVLRLLTKLELYFPQELVLRSLEDFEDLDVILSNLDIRNIAGISWILLRNRDWNLLFACLMNYTAQKGCLLQQSLQNKLVILPFFTQIRSFFLHIRSIFKF